MVHPLSVMKLRDVLLEPRQWKIVSTLFPPEIHSVNDNDFSIWLSKHSHSHPMLEVMIALDGVATMGLENTLYSVTPGTIIIFGPNEVHALGYRCSVSMWFAHLWIQLLPDRHEVVYSLRRGHRHVDTASLRYSLSAEDAGISLDAILNDAFMKRDQEPGILRSKVVGSIALIMAAIAERAETPTKAATQSFQQEVIETIREYISRTGGRDATLDNLARMAGYSKFHLSRLFRQYTGRSVHAYIDLCRTAKINELTSAGRTQTEIAQELGFSCLSAYLTWQAIQRKRLQVIR